MSSGRRSTKTRLRFDPSPAWPYARCHVKASLLAPADEKQLAQSLRRKAELCLHLPPWPGIAAAALALHTRKKPPVVVVVTDGPVTMDRVATDAEALAAAYRISTTVRVYPALESLTGQGIAAAPSRIVGDRLDALRAARHHPAEPLLLITCVQALMQKTVAPAWLDRQSMDIATGAVHDPAALLPWLEESGYAFEAETLVPGQASWRGGILDVWPPGHDWPVRIEFFGNSVDSLRLFDPVEQRSREHIATVTLPPAVEQTGPEALRATVIDHLATGAAWLWADRENITAHAELYEASAREKGVEDTIVLSAALKECVAANQSALQAYFSLTPAPDESPVTLDFAPLSGIPGALDSGAGALDRVEEMRRAFLNGLFEEASSGWSVSFFFSTPGGRERFHEAYSNHLPASAAVTFHDGLLSESFRCPGTRTIAVGDTDIYGLRRDQPGRYDRAARRAREESGERIQSWTDIQPGDYVVHIEHGIGIYRGLFEIEVNGERRETLTIEYAEGAKIHLPTGQTRLLSRYVGIGKRRPTLHAIGGKRWDRERAAAARAVEDMAAMLLETQAARDAQPGHAFSPDTPWQREFEAAFPFDETPDQAAAIKAVKADQESTRPMDRLICGDVGYGKTEVAMRAAFKAVMDGKQVAMLVPTTVLAQQHVDTFTARMAAFPVRVECLSRFQSKAAQLDTLERLANGTVDIVIGTHRLVQKDVRFRDLGLVIIDEEQRFGVKHKEFLKRLRHLVDVLTMTATPIPRTLYMSLTGARDLSIIETAPIERLPIETIVTERRDDIIREAILRELNREGQVYFLHNRVGTIDHLHRQLAALVPEARIRVAHGQMEEHRLSEAMRAFTSGAFDVLLCTTIIESGLNIPNVNTIIIDRADRFGLSELYQLRGRVGRHKRKAYAYLLLPRHGRVFFMARQRIGAIKRYTSLGSGFKLAMRDLELRGAGNILGPEQSGHIAAIGFDLYCQLLHRTVATMKGEAPPPVIDVDLAIDFITLSPGPADEPTAAVLPVAYIEDETVRVRLYRRLASIATADELDAFAAELRDRFGPLPEPADRLLLLSRIKLAAAAARITRIETDADKVLLTRDRDFIMPEGKFPRLPDAPPTRRLRALLKMVAGYRREPVC